MDCCIVYSSTAAIPFQEKDLSIILRQSRQFNEAQGVTGVLLYIHGNIIQVLEGEQAVVNALYRRIEQDSRHKNITAILNIPITHRLFGSWGMGYETITVRQLDVIQTVVDLNNTEGTFSESDDHIILKIIKVFYKSNHCN
ncbi:MAG: BLUF domain-containing protein [Bacteroidetes bacterium]|nr:BLUF domain-containing protein [Fibrella sp.]